MIKTVRFVLKEKKEKKEPDETVRTSCAEDGRKRNDAGLKVA